MKKLNKNGKQYLLSSIRVVSNFPIEGVQFRDITTLLNDKDAFMFLLEHLKDYYEKKRIDFIVGVESRGFVLAAALSAKLSIPFVPVRKPNKLPFLKFSCEYTLEYGQETLQIHQDAFRGMKNPKVLLIDDVLATGGTAIAGYNLIKKAGGDCIGACFLMHLSEFDGLKKLSEYTKVYSVLEL
ncbi:MULTISPECIES: adenine phosphoribosyltransferase [unclassified Campylobacter]|uniref:adenine phosphoribosyltransferase n=1 Tax=unclassified Campylobacter TaxID=2593542 RepID=UPI001237BB2C|nr:MULTISPECIES: adenine phosphoribosyltransferase [unclassified Campylobacter]KAA6228419.1 adenine phosphoribosyltransferase [Campylobacter sp. LR185c]KAA6228905.1 adenine phosphoribosyltransferase [Campylobacter sp. LR196d]KAA6229392.1 adenine phosphoribosyltransferase [Campylobacter sp. LR286c]KAA6229858.1 adenine phosphoribosyltransferase [Campylobacter sp. LR264d]KAA6234070.1 adenine phosphoribosyltransferase [Campylobacter sp. LR291e]